MASETALLAGDSGCQLKPHLSKTVRLFGMCGECIVDFHSRPMHVLTAPTHCSNCVHRVLYTGAARQAWYGAQRPGDCVYACLLCYDVGVVVLMKGSGLGKGGAEQTLASCAPLPAAVGAGNAAMNACSVHTRARLS